MNEEIGITEQGTVGDETYHDVMKDFSLFALNQPHKLQRPKTVVVQDEEEDDWRVDRKYYRVAKLLGFKYSSKYFLRFN